MNFDALNKEFILFIREYKKTLKSKDLIDNFLKIKSLFKLNSYNDSNNTLEYDDFESIALTAFWKAIMKFDENKSDNPTYWIVTLVKQAIIREIKRICKNNKYYMNMSRISTEINLENMISSNSTGIDIIQNFNKEVSDLHFFLSIVDKNAAMVFQLKLAFPEMSRSVIAKILGYKRRNGISKLIKIIKVNTLGKLDKDILEYIFRYENNC